MLLKMSTTFSLSDAISLSRLTLLVTSWMVPITPLTSPSSRKRETLISMKIGSPVLLRRERTNGSTCSPSCTVRMVLRNSSLSPSLSKRKKSVLNSSSEYPRSLSTELLTKRMLPPALRRNTASFIPFTMVLYLNSASFNRFLS